MLTTARENSHAVDAVPVNFRDPNGLFACMVGVGEGAEITNCDVLVMTLAPLTLIPSAAEPTPFVDPHIQLGQRRAKVVDAIHLAAKGDAAFGQWILDCMAGRESAYDSNADNHQGHYGLYQFNEAAWEDAYKPGSPGIPFDSGVTDPSASTAVMVAYLNRMLARTVGYDRYVNGQFTESDLRESIRRAGNGTLTYANQVLDCSKALKAGDFDAAMSALGK